MMPTLSELRDQVRQKADMENTQFVKDPELNGYINASALELYDLLVSRYEDYFSTTETFTLSGTNSHALPSDFYKLRGLDFQCSGSDWNSVRAFNFTERNSLNRLGTRIGYGIRDLSYRLMGSNLLVLPENGSDGTYKLWYIPRFTKLVDDADELTGLLDFEEYVVVDSAIKCLIKEESDTSALMAAKQQLLERVKAMTSDRDSGQPQVIGDVYASGSLYDEFFPR